MSFNAEFSVTFDELDFFSTLNAHENNNNRLHFHAGSSFACMRPTV